ncbi:hypothetical protein T265_10269 [Opisthorchis viverrini]|uniref:Uncharacterized protein n=1 Tax=Opisthorchis viverrini TaxID=6198 RepID=A0A074Z2V0_OPIVI|nr:hypothetical protein T265_10269 [Opisthorchis viverrini]KER21396.1 hypothetical protein T265_10269 [Opisthorchis viverrini]
MARQLDSGIMTAAPTECPSFELTPSNLEPRDATVLVGVPSIRFPSAAEVAALSAFGSQLASARFSDTVFATDEYLGPNSLFSDFGALEFVGRYFIKLQSDMNQNDMLALLEKLHRIVNSQLWSFKVSQPTMRRVLNSLAIADWTSDVLETAWLLYDESLNEAVSRQKTAYRKAQPFLISAEVKCKDHQNLGRSGLGLRKMGSQWQGQLVVTDGPRNVHTIQDGRGSKRVSGAQLRKRHGTPKELSNIPASGTNLTDVGGTQAAPKGDGCLGIVSAYEAVKTTVLALGQLIVTDQWPDSINGSEMDLCNVCPPKLDVSTRYYRFADAVTKLPSRIGAAGEIVFNGSVFNHNARVRLMRCDTDGSESNTLCEDMTEMRGASVSRGRSTLFNGCGMYLQHRTIKETIHKVAENYSAAHDRFRPS